MDEWMRYGRWTILACLLGIATASDLRTRRIPNWLSLSGCLVGLLLSALISGSVGAMSAGAGMLLAFAIALPFWLIGWVGAGDVKLLAAVGAFVGSGLVFKVLIATGLAGGLLAAGALMWRGMLGQMIQRMIATFSLSLASRSWQHVTPNAQESAVRLPYAVAITLGTLGTVLLFGL